MTMGVVTELEKRTEKVLEIKLEKSTDERLSEKYQIFIGHKINKAIFRVKGKRMVEFAESLGDLNPKYVDTPVVDGKPDYSNIAAHTCFPNCFTIDAAFDCTSFRFPPEEGENEGILLIPIPSKILHTGMEIDYSNAEIGIKAKQKLYTNGYCDEIYVRNNRLWIRIHLDTRTKEDMLVVQCKVMFVVREMGFAK